MSALTHEEKDALILRLRSRIKALERECGRDVVIPVIGETIGPNKNIARWAVCSCGEPVARFDLEYRDVACRKCGALIDWSQVDNLNANKQGG